LLNHFFPQTASAAQPPADFAQRADEDNGVYFWNNRFGQTTIEKLLLLPEAVTISTAPDDRLRVDSGGIGRTFTETERDRFVRSDGQGVLVFHRDEAGRVTSASLNSRAAFMLERSAWYETPVFTFGALVNASYSMDTGESPGRSSLSLKTHDCKQRRKVLKYFVNVHGIVHGK
jgi:hypothetical protein